MSVDHVSNTPWLPTVATLVPYAMTATTPHVIAPGTDHCVVLYRTITPYRPNGWKQALSFAGLTHSFPNLVHDMTHGPPIGNPPPLTHTIISNNLRLVDIYPLYMDNFIQEELNSSQFDGPYTVEEAHKIFGGHFCTAPLGFVEKPSSMSLRLIHHHLKEDDFGQSTNSWLDPSVDATRFYMAADTAEFVSEAFMLLFVPSMVLVL